MNRTYNLLKQLQKKLAGYAVSDPEAMEVEKWFPAVQEAFDRKNLVKRLSKAANEKPKAFFKQISEGFDSDSVAQVAAKVLLYSRLVDIDKIAECIGGKEDIHKQCLAAYLASQDYSSNDIEICLRSFMQTFRMAGIDSQVVFRILEDFGAKFYERDTREQKLFANAKESYEFAYLLIVL